MTCHTCGATMYEDSLKAGKWWCRCGSWRLSSESSAEVAAREAETAQAMAELDAAIDGIAEQRGTRERRDQDRRTTTMMEATMGQLIQTRGCSGCGGTMYKTQETNDKGEVVNSGPYICSACGKMEG